VRIGVLASGSGTILEAILAERLPVGIVVVDRVCRATQVAEDGGVACQVLERDSYGRAFDRVAYTERHVDILRAHDVDVVVMAGFGTILAQEAVPVLPDDTVESLHERIKHVERTLYPKTIREFIESHA
jgi:folate-dependent phosphoribosylglycinamide formyltransferase PurN